MMDHSLIVVQALLDSLREGHRDVFQQALSSRSQRSSDNLATHLVKEIVRHREKQMLVDFVKVSGRCRRFFKHNIHKLGLTSEEIEWIFYALYDDVQEKDLALHVAVTTFCNFSNVLAKFCREHPQDFDLSKRQFQKAFNVLYYKKSENEGAFRQCVTHLVSPSLSSDMCEENLRWLFHFATGCADFVLASHVCCTTDGCKLVDLSAAKSIFLHKSTVVQEELFRNPSEEIQKEFLVLFQSMSTLLGSELFTQLFMSTAEKAVDHNMGDLFAAVCSEFYNSNAVIQRCMKKECWLAHKDTKCNRDIYKHAHEFAVRHGKLEFCLLTSDKYCSSHEVCAIAEVLFENKVWSAFSKFPEWVKKLSEEPDSVCFLDFFLDLVLKDEESWADFAPILDGWLKIPDFGNHHERVHCGMHGNWRIAEYNVSYKSRCKMDRFASFCKERGCFHLALFTALLDDDQWSLCDSVLTSHDNIQFSESLHTGFAAKAAKACQFSLATALLKSVQVTGPNIKRYMGNASDRMAQACHKQGLHDWAVVLGISDDNWTFVKLQLQFPLSQLVLDHIVSKACFWLSGDFFGGMSKAAASKLLVKMLHRFDFDNSTVKKVMIEACRFNCTSLAEACLGFIDPTTLCDFSQITLSPDSNLVCLVQNFDPRTLLLLVGIGLSAFLRKQDFVDVGPNWCLVCPIMRILESQRGDDFKANLRYLLDSGAYSQSALYRLRKSTAFKTLCGPARHNSSDLERARDMIDSALATPSSLQHLARLEVSYAIGCQPGRKKRIKALILPQPLKNLLNFKDIVRQADTLQFPSGMLYQSPSRSLLGRNYPFKFFFPAK